MSYEVDTERGKGSHWQFTLGTYKATIPSGEIHTGTLLGILKKLRIDREEF
ncbi:MAG: type II toxin-antitoxin system HicA family toxin [Chloroflexota bacterium]|nr:type II toxin-antitoxin system HicA family toxin [Chloroflexota bacterium]